MMRAVILLAAIGLATPTRAQMDFMANGDFENFAGGTCPSAQVYLTGSAPEEGWSIERGTPDHLCSYTGGGPGAEMPHLYRADVAHKGGGYILLLGSAGGGQPEAYRYTPATPLRTGTNYTLSFWAKAPKNLEGGTFLLKGASGATYAVQSVSAVSAWAGYSFAFTPAQDEPYFILTTASSTAGVALDEMSLSPTSPLSLHIRFFDGAVRGSNAVLEWEMTEEHGLESFSIERSRDGRGFQRIGHYPATSGFTTRYTLVDTALPAGAPVMYRLRVLDIGGISRYSRTLSLQRPADPPRMFSLVPNPTRATLRIAGFKEPGSVRIFSTDGRMVWAKDAVAEGDEMDVSGLPAGVYFLECRSALGTSIERFVKE